MKFKKGDLVMIRQWQKLGVVIERTNEFKGCGGPKKKLIDTISVPAYRVFCNDYWNNVIWEDQMELVANA